MNDVGEPWKCSNRDCDAVCQTEDGAIPADWIGIRCYPGRREERPRNLGVFCGLDCAFVAVDAMRARRARAS